MRNIQEIPKNLTNGLDNVIVLFLRSIVYYSNEQDVKFDDN